MKQGKYVGQLSFLMLLLGFLCWGCGRQDRSEVSDNPSITSGRRFVVTTNIYFLDQDTISQDGFIKKTKELLPQFERLSGGESVTDRDGYTLLYTHDFSGVFALPDTIYLKTLSKDLNASQRQQLKQARGVLSVTFTGFQDSMYYKQYQIAHLIHALCSKTNCLIEDRNTFSFFDSRSWKVARIDKFEGKDRDVASQIVIRMYQTGTYCRAVTLGMDKFGLPDLTIPEFDCERRNYVGHLVNLTAQTLAEQANIQIDSSMLLNIHRLRNEKTKQSLLTAVIGKADTAVRARLSFIKPSAGDNINRQVEIGFFGDGPKTEVLEKGIATLFGTRSELVYSHHGAAIVAASRKAQKRLPELKAAFASGKIAKGDLYLKIALGEPNKKREWIWIKVLDWGEGTDLSGIVQSDAETFPNIKAGGVLRASEQEIFDYVFYNKQGQMEGNETEKLLKH